MGDDITNECTEHNLDDIREVSEKAASEESPSVKTDSSLDDQEDKKSGSDVENGESPTKTVGTFGTIMNLLNALLGAGILAVSNSFIQIGLFPALVILSIMAALSYYGSVLVIYLQLEENTAGFDELCHKIAGKGFSIAYSVLLLLLLNTILMGYIIIAGDFIISWFALANIDLRPMWRRAAMILVYSLCLPVALTIPRSIKFLSYFSTATVICVGWFAVAMIIRACTNLPKNGIGPGFSYGRFNIDLFYSIAIYSLTFALPCTCPPILHAYEQDSKKRKVACFWSMFICFGLVIVPGILGYILFGENAQGNIINNFPNNDKVMILVRIGFFLVITFSYPCIAQPTMSSYSQLFFKLTDVTTLPLCKRVVVQLCVHVTSIAIAMFLPESKPILGIGGAVSGCVVNFTYPAVLWWLKKRYSWKSLTFWGLVSIGVFGIIAGIISTVLAVMDAIAAFKKNKA